MKTLVIDCNYFCYYTVFTTDDFLSGFIHNLQRLYDRFKPCEFVFCWDSKQSRRRLLYPAYKAKRIPDPSVPHQVDERLAKAKPLFDVIRVDHLGLYGANYMQVGYEADDLIAEIVMNPGNFTHSFVIVSGDQDLYQLLDYAVIFSKYNRKVYTKSDFVEEYQIQPSDWVLVKALAGCDSDNIDGVPLFGLKTAIAYVTGDLKPGSKAAISLDENRQIFERNFRLIELPHHGTKPIQLESESLISSEELLEELKKRGENQSDNSQV